MRKFVAEMVKMVGFWAIMVGLLFNVAFAESDTQLLNGEEYVHDDAGIFTEEELAESRLISETMTVHGIQVYVYTADLSKRDFESYFKGQKSNLESQDGYLIVFNNADKLIRMAVLGRFKVFASEKDVNDLIKENASPYFEEGLYGKGILKLQRYATGYVLNGEEEHKRVQDEKSEARRAVEQLWLKIKDKVMIFGSALFFFGISVSIFILWRKNARK